MLTTYGRFLTIIQLSIVFSVFLWIAVQPFMGEYFALRSRMLIYEFVFGEPPSTYSADPQLIHNYSYFKFLPSEEQILLKKDYHILQTYAQRPIWTKIADGIHFVLFDLAPFKLAWLFFSGMIAIFLLLKIDGAKTATWILPLLACAYGIENYLQGVPAYQAADQSLFPSEEEIIIKYLKEPLSTHWKQQKEQLKKGWDAYLIQQWGSLEEGQFYFNLNRLRVLRQQTGYNWLRMSQAKEPSIALVSYILWNFFFAWHLSGFRQKDKKWQFLQSNL